MNIIHLEEAQNDLDRVVLLANDGGPVMIWREGRIVAELHSHREHPEEGAETRAERNREEVFRSMDRRRERSAKYTAAESDDFRRQGRRS
jgi:antitoxin (DNA-binding transcriptional repressor) of toxin-antitoxin stability system